MPDLTIGFGDNVRIRDTPATRERSLAGLTGQVFGLTTPSITSVEVIGTLSSDIALNVHFDELKSSSWFAPELVELIDHAPGSEIRLDGVAKKWTRQSDGTWLEEATAQSAPNSRPWWKFW